MPYEAVYGASKAFLLSFTAALRAELGGTGVRVLSVSPGPVATEFQETAGVGGIKLVGKIPVDACGRPRRWRPTTATPARWCPGPPFGGSHGRSG